MHPRRDRTTWTTLAAIAVLALGAWSLGCGDDDSGDGGDGGGLYGGGGTATDGDGTTAGGAGGGAERPEELVECLEGEDLTATETEVPADADNLGLTGTVRVEGDAGAVVFVNFFESAEDARSYSERESVFLEGAGAGGGSDVVGTATVGTSKSEARDEANAAKDCLA